MKEAENELYHTPPQKLWPGFANVPYTLAADIHQLTILEFLKKITQPKTLNNGRFIISFINIKDHSLIFPDEAMGGLSKDGFIFSGYYEEVRVIAPYSMDVDCITNHFPLDKRLVAKTKRSGNLPILDVVSFEYQGCAFNAIVVDQVIDNGVCLTVKDWKDRIKADTPIYDQSLCQDTNNDKHKFENQLKQWLEDAEAHYQSGLQVVDNFYLDFLKESPKEYISVVFEPEKPQGATYCSYQRWEAMSDRVFYALRSLFFDPWRPLSKEGSHFINNLYYDGNLNLHVLQEKLNEIEEDVWSKRLKELSGIEKIEPDYERLSRIGLVMCYLCELVKHENIPSEVCNALWDFHKQKANKGVPYNIWRMSEKEYAITKEQEQLEEWFGKMCAKANGLPTNTPSILRLERLIHKRIASLNQHYESIGKERPVGPNEERYYSMNDSKD